MLYAVICENVKIILTMISLYCIIIMCFYSLLMKTQQYLFFSEKGCYFKWITIHLSREALKCLRSIQFRICLKLKCPLLTKFRQPELQPIRFRLSLWGKHSLLPRPEQFPRLSRFRPRIITHLFKMSILSPPSIHMPLPSSRWSETSVLPVRSYVW